MTDRRSNSRSTRRWWRRTAIATSAAAACSVLARHPIHGRSWQCRSPDRSVVRCFGHDVQSSRSGMRAASSNCLLARRPKRIDQHQREHRNEVSRPQVWANSARLCRWRSMVISPDVGFVVVELEVDLRAEHLQVGDQRVGFGDALRIAVEVSTLRLWIALGQLDGVGMSLVACATTSAAALRSSPLCKARQASPALASHRRCARNRARSLQAMDSLALWSQAPRSADS